MSKVSVYEWEMSCGAQVKVTKYYGKLVHWGVDSYEDNGYVLTYTVAIVEKEDGHCESVPIDMIRFT